MDLPTVESVGFFYFRTPATAQISDAGDPARAAPANGAAFPRRLALGIMMNPGALPPPSCPDGGRASTSLPP